MQKNYQGYIMQQNKMEKAASHNNDYRIMAINFCNISEGVLDRAEESRELLKKRKEFFNKFYETAITPSASCSKASATQFEGRAVETIFV